MSVDGVYILYEIETWFSYVVVPADNEAATIGTVTDGEYEGTVAGAVVATERVGDIQGES